jgi:hypothetical protein
MHSILNMFLRFEKLTELTMLLVPFIAVAQF